MGPFYHQVTMQTALRWILSSIFALGLGACAIVGGGAELERASDYNLKAPADWKTQSKGESDSAYKLPSGNVVSLVSSCNRNPDAPLDVLTRHLLMGTRGVTISSREKKTFGANEGLYSKVVAKLEGKPFHLDLFVLAKEKCVFDFSLISPKPISESDATAFKQFIESFQYGKN
jgi:hypothetical protein